jgi:hypothetical protein
MNATCARSDAGKKRDDGQETLVNLKELGK